MMRNSVPVLIGLIAVCISLTACGDNRSEEQRLIDANLKMEQQSYRSAIIELRNVLRNNPKSLEARLALSRALDRVGDFDAAEKEVDRAVELGAQPDEYLATRAHIYAGRGEHAVLLAEIDPAAVTSPALASELAALRAKSKLALGSTDEAKTEFEGILADGKSTEAQRIALMGLSSIAQSKADFERAEELARQALSIAPDSAESFLQVGMLLIVETEFEDAVKFLSDENAEGVRFTRMQRLQHLGERAQAYLGLGDLDKADEAAVAMSQIASDHPMSGFLRGQVAYRRGDYDSALEIMQGVAAKYPTFVPVQALLGAVSMKRGEFEQAEVYLTTAIAAQPDNASARQLLAETRMRLQRPEQAAETLREGLRNDEDNPLLLAMLGRATVRLGDDTAGIELLEKSLAASPGNPQIILALSAAYVGQGEQTRAAALIDQLPADAIDPQQRQVLEVVTRFDENDTSAASARLDDILAASPQDASVLLLAGNFYLATEDSGRAREMFEKVLAIEPDNRGALTGILRSDEKDGDFSRSRALFANALEANPGDDYAMMVLARIAEVGGNHERALELINRAHDQDPRALSPNLFLASDALRSGELDTAERHARLALTNHEQSARAQLAIGMVYMRKRQFAEALPHLRRATELAPDEYYGFHQLGSAQLALNRLAQARESFREVYRLNPRHLPSLRSLAVLEVKAGNSQQADQLVRFAGDYLGAGPELDEMTGDVRRAQEKYSEAQLSYNRAYAARPTWGLARKLFATRQKIGSPDATLPLRQWLDSHPDHVPARVLLAQTYLNANDAPKAIEQYEMLILQQPDSAYALNNLAWLYFTQEGAQNRTRALEIATKANRLAPLNADIADTLGWIQFNSGQVSEGLETLRAAMSATTPRRSPDIAYHLAAVLHETGAHDEARETLIQALTTTRPFQSRDDAQKLLDSL